jgi:chemotaxis protein MotB
VVNSFIKEVKAMNMKKVMGGAALILMGVFLASCGANKELVMENQDLSASLQASKARSEELETKLAEAERALETAKGALEAKEKELADLGLQLNTASGQVDDLQSRLGDVREALQNSFAETDSLERTIQELQGTLRASESEKTRQIAQLSSRKQELEKQIIDVKSELNRATKRGDDLGIQVSGMKADLVNRETEIKELKNERTTLLKTISDLNTTFKARTDDLSAQVSLLMKKNDDLNVALDSASRRSEQQGETIDAYRRTITEQASALEELADKLEALEAEKQDLEYKISAIEQDRSMLLEEEELEKQRIKETYENLLSSLKGEIDEKTIEIQNFKDALTINMMDKIFFDSGKAIIKPDGLNVLDRIAPILKNLEGKNIRIEGHTDDVPISAKIKSKYPSNWELGAARSSAVARYFIEKHGIDPARISAVSYSYYRPIVPNISEENRARNRRIEIVLIDRSLYEMMETPQNQ